MSYGMIAMAAVTLVGGIIQGQNAKKNREISEGQYADAKKEREKQQQALNLQKQEYKNMNDVITPNLSQYWKIIT